MRPEGGMAAGDGAGGRNDQGRRMGLHARSGKDAADGGRKTDARRQECLRHPGGKHCV